MVKGLSPEEIDPVDRRGDTPLLLAIRRESTAPADVRADEEIVDLLLTRGARHDQVGTLVFAVSCCGLLWVAGVAVGGGFDGCPESLQSFSVVFKMQIVTPTSPALVLLHPLPLFFSVSLLRRPTSTRTRRCTLRAPSTSRPAW